MITPCTGQIQCTNNILADIYYYHKILWIKAIYQTKKKKSIQSFNKNA